MQSGQNEQSPEQVQASLEEEVRRGRKFTAQEAMARLAGPSAMAGASPVSAVQQAETEIANWLRSHVPGASELQEREGERGEQQENASGRERARWRTNRA